MSAEFSKEEADELLEAFKALEVKPKAASPGDLMAWMKDFIASKHEMEETKPAIDSGHTGAMPKQVLTNQIRLPVFSGDGKADISFDLWKYEVTCLQREKHSTEIIRQAIRRSLRGEAGRIAMRLGPDASVEEILQKMESVYGEVEQRELLLAKFYSARQQEQEDVSTWGCRLEDLLSKAVEKGTLSPKETKNMLRVMFWSGLRSDLKDTTGHLFDTITDFDGLRVAIRRVEQDHKHRLQDNTTSTSKKTGSCKSAVVEENKSFGELKGMIQQLTTEVKTLKDNQEKMQSRMETGPQPHQYGRQSQYHTPRQQNQPAQRQEHPPPQRSTRQQNPQQANREPEPPIVGAQDDFVCWRCGQLGHISRGCRVRLDHMRRQPLNYDRPVPGGRH